MELMGFISHLRSILGLYIVAGVFSPVFPLTSPCQQSLIDQCGRLITGFTPQKYLSGLVPDSAIRDDCEAFASVRLCNDKVLRPCLAAELVTLDPFIRQANEFIMLFCENDQFRRDYAHHGQCLAVVSSDINQCIANYGATVSDIAAISDNLAPQEVLHRSCCDGLHRLTQCSWDAAVRKCHPSSADFVKKFLYKMMKSTLQDWIARQCFEYQTQCGRDLGLDADAAPGRVSIPPLGNNTASQQPDAPPAESEMTITTRHPAGKEATLSSSPAAIPTTTRPSGTKKQQQTGNAFSEMSADGTDHISSHSGRPDGNQPTALSPGKSPSPMADDGMASSSAVVVPVAPTDTSNTGFYGSSLHRPVNIKTVPEKSPSKSRAKNFGSDTHPLARKFLLIISTIAFLCGWY